MVQDAPGSSKTEAKPARVRPSLPPRGRSRDLPADGDLREAIRSPQIFIQELKLFADLNAESKSPLQGSEASAGECLAGSPAQALRALRKTSSGTGPSGDVCLVGSVVGSVRSVWSVGEFGLWGIL